MGVGAGVLSFALNHPFPETIGFPAVSVYVGAGRVVITPVVVYVGKAFAATGAALIEAGGHAIVDLSSPAPAPPVIHESNWPLNIGPAEAPHVPIALLGSFGIQPPCRPSW